MRLGGRGTVGRKVSVWKGTLNILEPNYNLGRHEFSLYIEGTVNEIRDQEKNGVNGGTVIKGQSYEHCVPLWKLSCFPFVKGVPFMMFNQASSKLTGLNVMKDY